MFGLDDNDEVCGFDNTTHEDGGYCDTDSPIRWDMGDEDDEDEDDSVDESSIDDFL